ncbi:MAG: type II secretion system protein GspN [Myxococcota bacterium]|jgi:type II secretion system protein N|nr:type II secretion system protein GspN [Myxococcota bacterium]
MAALWDKKALRIALYCSWTVLFFLFSLVWTYPSDALVAEVEAAVQKSGVLKTFEVDGASLSGLGVALTGVKVVSKAGDANLPWAIDRVWIGLNGFSFDPKKPALRFAVDAYQGSLSGLYDNGRLELSIEKLDLASIMPLQKIVKIGLSGQVEGDLDLKLDTKKGLRSLAGSLDLQIVKTAIGPGEVPIPGFGASLTLPKATVGDLPISAKIIKGEVEIKPFKVTGGDVEFAGEGTVNFVGSLSSSRFDLAFDVHPTDKLKASQEGKNLLTALDPSSPLLPGRIKRSFSKAGWLGISITGRMSRPRIKVRKSNVN